MFVDTHCHLHDERIKDVDATVAAFVRDGVDFVINMGCCAETSETGKNLAEKYAPVYFAAGCHPSDANKFNDDEKEKIAALTSHPKCVAIGEIGLDYYWEPYDKKLQKDVFVSQLELAKACKLPVSVHCRDATGDMLEILKTNKAQLEYGGVMHCFSGSKETAAELIKLGFYISFAGPLTFKNANRAVEAAKFVPNEFLLTETDCPFLAPHPLRGTTNEPKNVALVTAFMANLKGVELSEFASVIKANAKRLFKKI